VDSDFETDAPTEAESSAETAEITVIPPPELPPDSHVNGSRGSTAYALGEMAMVLAIRSAQIGVTVGRSFFRAATERGPGRVLSEAVTGAVGALGRDGAAIRRIAEPLLEEPLGRVIALVTPVVVQSIDPEDLVESVDVNALLDRVDVNALLSRVDVDALLDRVDVDALLDRIDVNALLDRADVNAVARRAKIGELVAESTGDVAGSALDTGRRQAVALDTLLARAVDRVLGRDPETLPQGPPALTDTGDETA
jgi:hypothetical protein